MVEETTQLLNTPENDDIYKPFTITGEIFVHNFEKWLTEYTPDGLCHV